MPAPDPTPPDSRNWAAEVLAAGCPSCGFAPGPLTPSAAAIRVRAALPRWSAVLARPDARDRPGPTTWSPVEYASHVRDLGRLLPARLASMLAFDDPEFANWDQDRAAVERGYWAADPDAVARDLAGWAAAALAALDAAPDDQLDRTGRRSDGTTLTVAELCANFAHEVVHHLRDAGGTETDDHAAIAEVVRRFFAAFVSGPDAAERIADLRAVLLPEAVIVRTCGEEPLTYDVKGFIAPRAELLASGRLSDFREWVTAGRTDVYGDVAQHWCGYAKSWTAGAGRGMKTVQLVRTAAGWRISAAAWDDERPGIGAPAL